MKALPDAIEGLPGRIRRDRLVENAVALISIPGPTGDAGRVAACLASILEGEGFPVERPEAAHPASPAVVARLDSGSPGPVLQLDGHIDTVHLPFVPARVEGGRIHGSGAADMKSGVAAALEALIALREAGLPRRGSVLFTAHDLHEAPWGFGQQLDALIASGVVGDAVLIPEPLSDRLPVAGRGAATWRAVVRRSGPPVHEVMRPASEPSVIAAGAELVRRLVSLGHRLSARCDPVAGSESVFMGQVHAGEIYNGFPSECLLEGTRRWLDGTRAEDAAEEIRALAGEVARETGTSIDLDFRPIRGAFRLDVSDPIVHAFEDAHLACGLEPPARGPKPFVDDGNSFWSIGRVPAITHGPLAGGQHTLEEWASIDDLVRVAQVYALTASAYLSRS